MLKIEMNKINIVIIVSCAAAAAIFLVYIFLFAPLVKNLGVRYRECRAIETNVREVRGFIESVGRVYEKRSVFTEEDASQALEELTRHGKEKGIDFISINQKELEKKELSQYKIMPVDFKIQATNKQIAEFLGSLDELPKGLVKVKCFKMIPDEKDKTLLLADIMADVYVSVEKNA